MNDFLTFLSVALSIYTLIVYIIACSSLAKTAEDKGHESRGLGFACFFLGIPYMIWVASLPDLKARNYSGNDSRSTTTKLAEVPSGGWECPSCHAGNASYVGTCSCGTRKPRM